MATRIKTKNGEQSTKEKDGRGINEKSVQLQIGGVDDCDCRLFRSQTRLGRISASSAKRVSLLTTMW